MRMDVSAATSAIIKMSAVELKKPEVWQSLQLVGLSLCGSGRPLVASIVTVVK